MKIRVHRFLHRFGPQVAAVLDASVEAEAAYHTDVYSYSPDTLSISAFSSPGILSIGPELVFRFGVEVMVDGKVDIEANVTATSE